MYSDDYEDGYNAGHEQGSRAGSIWAYREIEKRMRETHRYGCDCEPCRVLHGVRRALQQAAEPRLWDG